MAPLLTCYDGKGLEEAIAELLVRYYSSLPVRTVYEPLEPDVVARWFESPDYEVESFAVIERDSGGLLGLAWAWVTSEEEPIPQGFARIVLDPYAPTSDLYDAALKLLSWIRHSLEAWQEVRGVVDIFVGGEGDLATSIICRVAPCSPDAMLVRGYVMTAPDEGIRGNPPGGYKVREARPHESQGDVKALVEIFNDAFSVYDTFWPWRIESAQRYYKDLFERRRAVVYVAYSENGDPAGFVEVYMHPTLSGGLAGEISLLAVKRSHQSRGLGAYLLSLADQWLRSHGARVVYLDAMPLAARLYLKLGFRIIYQYYRARLTLQSLPDLPIDGVRPWSPEKCPGPTV